MKTKIIKLNPAQVEPKELKIIAVTISREGVMAYPTDTFYGLGADCFSGKAVRRIFRLKKRPLVKALPVLISDPAMARKIAVSIPPVFDEITSSFWPGPLTLLLHAARHLPEELVGPGRTIGVRMPSVAWLRELVEEIGSPLTATSANISGKGEIASPEKVVDLFKNRVELIVDGGEAPGGRPSTVVDLTLDKPRLIREGAFPEEKLRKYL
ncbi:MAG: L-threonylcarbamoyladenylate synthase [Clostridiales bacterium]|nr:L-threonylcarbamoyladenylate synthase [Clostridiales bacterium]